MTDRPAASTIRQILRGVRAEALRVGGPRSTLLLTAVAAGVLVPLLITFGIAYVAERISHLDSTEISVTVVTSSNSVYWILTFSVVVGALIAAYAQAASMRGAARDLDRYLYPRAWTSAVSRWLYYGALSAAGCAILVAAVMSILPAAFPNVYGEVSLISSAGVRFLITVPIYAFLACGLGVGLACLIGHPAATMAVLLFWVFVVEDAVIFAPNGMRIQAYMPFLNAVWGTGQDLVIDPPWGLTGAEVYFALVSLAIFTLGLVAAGLRRRSRLAFRLTARS